MRRGSRRRAAYEGAFLLAIIAGIGLLAQPVTAQSNELPIDFDDDLAQQFEAELLAFIDEAGIDASGDALAGLLGEKGKFDEDPGTLVLLELAEGAGGLDAVGGSGDSKLTGPCMGLTMSLDPDFGIIDIAADFDPEAPPIDVVQLRQTGEITQAFTASNPYTVHVNGYVVYAGVAGPPGGGPRNHSWQITSFGAALDRGGDPNSAGENRNAGGIDLGSQLPGPAKINALFRVGGWMRADGGFECNGEGYFETTGGPPVAEGAGLALVVLGGLGGVFNARPARTWSG